MPLEIERTGGMEEDSQEEQEALIDRFEGLSHVGGRPELYEEVLKAYYHDGMRTLEQLSRAEELSVSERRVLVHGIKGSSYNIGATALGEEAEKIEHALKRGDVEYATENLPGMLVHLKEVLTCCAPVEAEEVKAKEKKETGEDANIKLQQLRDCMLELEYEVGADILNQWIDSLQGLLI